MKKILLFITLLLSTYGCSNTKNVYWCGDHACINNKEKEAYFKKTMIVEIKEVDVRNKVQNSETQKIIDQAKKNEKKRILFEKNNKEKSKIEEKIRAQQEKALAKKIKLDDKKRIADEKRKLKDEKKLAKKIKSDEKKIIKDKSSSKKITKSSNKVILETNDFDKIVENIINKDVFKPFPDINDIPN